jgi:hypothetical protein
MFFEGRHLYSKMKEALVMGKKHRAAFNTLTATFPDDIVVEWKAMLAEWLDDTNQPNPFEEITLGMF